MKDIEAAERLVEKSNGTFQITSTRRLDHYRDQFADALFSSDRSIQARRLMESSLDDAIRYYNGDTSRINRWDEPLEQGTDFGEEEAAETAEAVENAEKRLLEDRTWRGPGGAGAQLPGDAHLPQP